MQLCRYVGREEFFGKFIVEYGAYFLASYFAIGVIFDTFTLGVLAASAFQYSTNTEAFMAAVKEVAGSSKRGPNINVVEKAQTAVNAIKVASALNQISGLLKVSIGTDTACISAGCMLCRQLCSLRLVLPSADLLPSLRMRRCQNCCTLLPSLDSTC